MPAPSPEACRMRVLVVEDDDDTLVMTLELLESLGHWATGVKSAEGALNRFLEGAFDVLVADVGLPALSGCELAEMLQARCRVPVIFATGREPPAQAMQGTIWLQKPYSVAQMKQALSEAARLAGQAGPTT
ncbi:MAG: response regulator [Variovorax sp.]|nr:MAG: response regulator [Variovorax sp.]